MLKKHTPTGRVVAVHPAGGGGGGGGGASQLSPLYDQAPLLHDAVVPPV
jgi:hypothetical protein